MKPYEIDQIVKTKQDAVMKWTRYLVTLLETGEMFICTRYDNHRRDHVYFSEKTQLKVDENLLDEIERDIVNAEADKNFADEIERD
jgi:uncharacterized protein (AIM24 family)